MSSPWRSSLLALYLSSFIWILFSTTFYFLYLKLVVICLMFYPLFLFHSLTTNCALETDNRSINHWFTDVFFFLSFSRPVMHIVTYYTVNPFYLAIWSSSLLNNFLFISMMSPQNPQSRWTPFPRPTLPPRSSSSGNLPMTLMATSLTTWSSASASLKPASSTSLTTVRRVSHIIGGCVAFVVLLF